jgi:hypothetical protein
MGTERFVLYDGPCACGKGKYIIKECSPDHPWVKSHQIWLESTIDCPECKRKYVIENRSGKVYRILKSEIDKIEKANEKWHVKIKEIKSYVKDKGYIDKLEETIEGLPSVAAIYREYRNYLSYSCSESTFRKRFNWARSIEAWIDENIHYENWPELLRAMGIKDQKLSNLIIESKQLWKDANKIPPVIKPPICRGIKDN